MQPHESFEFLAFCVTFIGVTFLTSVVIAVIMDFVEEPSLRLRRWRTRRRHAKHRATQPPHAHRDDFELREPWQDLNGYDDSRKPG